MTSSIRNKQIETAGFSFLKSYDVIMEAIVLTIIKIKKYFRNLKKKKMMMSSMMRLGYGSELPTALQ